MLKLPGVNGGLYLRTQGRQGTPQVNYVSIEDIDKYTGMVNQRRRKDPGSNNKSPEQDGLQ